MPKNEKRSVTQQQFDAFVGHFTGLLDTQSQLLQLEIRAEVSKALGLMTVLLLLTFTLSMVVLGISIAFTLFLGQLLGSTLQAILLITAVYSLLLAVIWVRRKPLREQFAERIELKMQGTQLKQLFKAATSTEVTTTTTNSPGKKPTEHE